MIRLTNAELAFNQKRERSKFPRCLSLPDSENHVGGPDIYILK